jgi:hypothetical protein
MHRQPTALDRQLYAGAVLGWSCAIAKKKLAVDLFDVDAALDRSTEFAISRIRCAAFSGSA